MNVSQNLFNNNNINTFNSHLTYRHSTPGDLVKVFRRRYYLYTKNEDAGWQRLDQVPSIEIENGRLFVDGIEIVKPTISNDYVSWVQYATLDGDDCYLCGHLHVHSNGVEGHGTVSRGTSPADAVSHEVFATAVPAVTYSTQITSARHPAGTKPSSLPSSAWETGLELSITYQTEVGGSLIPTPVISLNGTQLPASDFFFTVDGNNTVLNFELDSVTCMIEQSFYQTASLSFDALVLNAPGNGSVTAMCSQPPSANSGGDVWLWKAECDTTAQDTPLPHPARRAVSKKDLKTADDTTLSVTELMTILPNDDVNTNANTMLMRNMKWAMGQNATQKEWLSEFFAQQPPVISDPGQKALAEKGLDWYQNDLAKAYLTQSFNNYAGPNAPTKRLSAPQQGQLTDYLQTGLAKSPDFNVQHTGIYVDSFIEAFPTLSNYINDQTPEQVGWATGTVTFSRSDASASQVVPIGTAVQTADGIQFTTTAAVTFAAGDSVSPAAAVEATLSGPGGIVAASTITAFSGATPTGLNAVTNSTATTLESDTGGTKWAKKLFTALTTGQTFILMVNRVAGANGDPTALGPLNNFSTLLTALQPSGALALDYYSSVMSGVVQNLTPSVVHQDNDSIMEWLPDTLQQLLQALADGELPQELDISKQEAQEMLQEYLENAADIDAAIADLLISIQGSGVLSQAEKAEAEFASTIASKWPKLAKMAQFMFVIGWIGGITSVVISIVRGSWSKMTAVEKGQFVTNTIQLGISAFDAVPALWLGVKSLLGPQGLKLWESFTGWFYDAFRRITGTRAVAAGAGEAGNLPEMEAKSAQALINETKAGGVIGKGTIFEKIFEEGFFSGALKIVGAVASAAMTGLSAAQLIEDIKNHGTVTTIVFDSLMLACNLVATMSAVASLFITSSVLPIVGAVMAILGLLLGFLSGLFKKAPNPLTQWMESYGIPFVAGLPAQTPPPSTSAHPSSSLAVA